MIQDSQVHSDEAKKNETTVTQKMIDKGCEVISRFFCFPIDDPENIVSAVYLAMKEAAQMGQDVEIMEPHNE